MNGPNVNRPRPMHELLGDLRATDNLIRLDDIRRLDGDYKWTAETAAEREARLQSVARLRAEMIAESLRHEVASGAWRYPPKPRPRRLSRYVMPVLLCIAAGIVLAFGVDTLGAVSSPREW